FVNPKERYAREGYPVTDDVLRQAQEAVAAIVAGIEAGRFPAHPDSEASTRPRAFIACHTCDPDGLGIVDLRRQWERKRADPDLEPYAAMVEPRPDDEEDEA